MGDVLGSMEEPAWVSSCTAERGRSVLGNEAVVWHASWCEFQHCAYSFRSAEREEEVTHLSALVNPETSSELLSLRLTN